MEQVGQWHKHPNVVVLPVWSEVNFVQWHRGGKASITVRLQFWAGVGINRRQHYNRCRQQNQCNENDVYLHHIIPAYKIPGSHYEQKLGFNFYMFGIDVSIYIFKIFLWVFLLIWSVRNWILLPTCRCLPLIHTTWSNPVFIWVLEVKSTSIFWNLYAEIGWKEITGTERWSRMSYTSLI